MKNMICVVAVVFVIVTAIAMEVPSVIVESVNFRQRYPWNGLVDIDVKITCSDPTTNLAVYVAAWDNVKDRALTVKTIWVDGDATKNPDLVTKSGTTRIVWDARADNPGEISDNVSLSVQSYVRDMRYLVVDLSGGTNATEFAYSFLPDPPEGGWTDEYKTEKLVLRLIPAGTFWMGSPEDEIGRTGASETLHRITLTKPFYMAVFETTKRQYELVMGGSQASDPTRPVSNISYVTARGDLVEFHWPENKKASPYSFIGKMQGKTHISTLDLPTRPQWEYACRAGTVSAFNNGMNLTTTNTWHSVAMDSIGRYNNTLTYDGAVVVGSYQPNAWGLYDMHGNVEEWCVGRHSRATAIDPEIASGDTFRDVCGGFWRSPSWDCRSTCPWGYMPTATDIFSPHNGSSSFKNSIGFRICCDANLLK